MKYAAVTCTGGRPELFELCKRWVMRQTLQPEVWIVTTDTGEKLSGLPPFAVQHEVGKVPDSYVTALSYRQANWALYSACKLVPEGLAMVVFEDDDWYHQDHARLGMEFMERTHRPLAFPKQRLCAHIPVQRWTKVQDRAHAWEMCHQVSAKFLPFWREEIMQYGMLSPIECFYDGLTCAEIKGVGFGLPGRTGVTVRHNPVSNKIRKLWPDPGWRELRAVLGADLDLYTRLLRKPECIP